MSALGEFGILPPRLASQPRFQERTTIPHEEYCAQAGELLLNLVEPVIETAVPRLERYPAKWQPMGFQIYDLGIYPELGFLRLHVWQKDLRRATQKRDVIHNHPRHIASTVLSGVYRDSIFDVRENPAPGSGLGPDEYTLYGKAIHADQTEALVSTGKTVKAVVEEERVITTGNQHFIAPGVFHQTQVPLGDRCVTLAFNSFRTTADGPYILLDEPPNPNPALREPIAPEDIEGVKNLFNP